MYLGGYFQTILLCLAYLLSPLAYTAPTLSPSPSDESRLSISTGNSSSALPGQNVDSVPTNKVGYGSSSDPDNNLNIVDRMVPRGASKLPDRLADYYRSGATWYFGKKDNDGNVIYDAKLNQGTRDEKHQVPLQMAYDGTFWGGTTCKADSSHDPMACDPDWEDPCDEVFTGSGHPATILKTSSRKGKGKEYHDAERMFETKSEGIIEVLDYAFVPQERNTDDDVWPDMTIVAFEKVQKTAGQLRKDGTDFALGPLIQGILRGAIDAAKKKYYYPMMDLESVALVDSTWKPVEG